MKHVIPFLKKHNLLFSLLVMGIATLFSFLYSKYIHDTSASIPLFYILALIVIAKWTDGYRYGIGAAVVAVIAINFFFTYPYYKFNFMMSGYPITFIGMTTISIITSTTTTHLKQQAQVLANRERDLAEADKEKMRANLLRAVSHDLRTPLTSIIGASSTYMDNYDSYSDEEKNKLVHNINDDANWLLNMVENLLTITRIQNDCQQVTTSPEVVDEVVAESVQRFKKRHPEAEVSVATPTDFLMIPMDAMLIEQVIINLLENALIHAHSKVPPLLSVDSDEDHVTFHVFDYGIGIAESRLPTLFDGSLDNPTATNHRKGMGIGLSICKTIVSAHNGTIGARNAESGAEFYFTLPKEDYHEQQIQCSCD